MRRGSLSRFALGIVAVLFGWPATAKAIPIIITSGETIVHLQDLPAAAKQEVRKELQCEPAVGFVYSHFGVFWCDLWTWNGRYVLYKDQKYWEIKPEGFQALLGKSEEELGKPFLYRFPLGLLILAGLVGVGILCQIFIKSDEERVKKMLQDHRYQHAVELLTPPANEPPPPVEQPPDTPSPQEKRYEAAVEYLVTEGIDRRKAEAHLLLIMQTLAKASS
jgi:hypothetical protein